jgi:hypothetical protein
MQPQQIRIKPGGLWHRRRWGNGRNATACGIHFHEQLIPATRDFVLDDNICEACHSRHEIQTAEMKMLEREAAEAEGEFVPLVQRIERRRRARDTIPDPVGDDDE